MAGGNAMPGMKRCFREKGEKKKEWINTHPGFKPLQFSHIETQILLFLGDHLILTLTHSC